MEEEKESILSFYVLTATVIFLSYISLWYIRRRRLSRPPRLPPGPKGLPLLASLPFLDPQLHSYLANLAEIYGPIFSIKLGLKLTIVVSSPSVAREILRDHDEVFANRDVPEAEMEMEVGKNSFFSFHFLTASTLVLLCYLCLRRGLSRPPRLPPGPKGLPLLGSLPFLDSQLHSYFANLAKIYGPIFSIKLGLKLTIVVSSPSVAREILRDHDEVFANRDVPEAGRLLTYGSSDILWNPNGPEWRMLRKIVSLEMVGGARLDAMKELREKEVAATIRRVRGNIDQPVNVGFEMFLTMLNLITSKLWGGKVEEGDDGLFQEELRVLVEEMFSLLGTPNVSDFLPILGWLDLQGVRAKTMAIKERFDQLFDAVIRRKVANGEDGKDFVDAMLRMEREGGSGGDKKIPFTRNNLKALMSDMILAGTDTISNTLEFAMAEMMSNPKILKKAQEEVDMVVGENNVVQEAHTGKLQYINAIIKETLRLHPAGPFLAPHCPSESCTINGYVIPKGARVTINVWAIHKDPLMWEKPLEFLPERFLQVKGNSEGWDFNGKNFRYIPFGSGRRICVGIGMAERMMPYMLASFLYSFDWRLPEGKELDMNEKFGFSLKKSDPLVIVPTLRVGKGSVFPVTSG